MKTKPNWLVGLCLTAISLLCLTTLSACNDDDDPTPVPSGGEAIEQPKDFLTDSLKVRLTSATYVFTADYDDVAEALVKRVQNKVASLDTTVQTVIMHNDNAASLTDADAQTLTRIVARGGGVVISEPTRRGVDALVRKMQTAIATLLHGNDDISPTLEGYATCRSIYNMKADESGLIVPTFLSTSSDPDEEIGDLVAIKGRKKYVVAKHDDDSQITTQVTTDGDEETAPVNGPTKVEEVDRDPSGRILGLHADALAAWLDTPDNALARQARGQAMLRQAQNGGEASTVVSLAESQQITHAYTAFVSPGKEEKVEVQYFIWAVRDVNEGADYYMVHQDIKCQNSQLNCGPANEAQWYQGDDVDAAFSDVDHNFRENIPTRLRAYWLYMTRFLARAEFCQLNAGENLSIMKVSPASNLTGTTRYESSITTEISAGITVSKAPGVNVKRGVTINETWSYDRPDLEYTFTYGGNGTTPQWNYDANQRPKHFQGSSKTRYEMRHTLASKVLVTDLTLGHSWIWKVTRAEKAYSFKSHIEIDLAGLWQGWKHKLTGDKPTTGEKSFRCSDEIVINLDRPARYEQSWIMEMVPENLNTQLYMKRYFSDVWMPAFVVNTIEQDDRTLVDKHINDVINRLKVKQAQLDSAHIPAFTLKWSQASSSDTYRQYRHEAHW